MDPDEEVSAAIQMGDGIGESGGSVTAVEDVGSGNVAVTIENGPDTAAPGESVIIEVSSEAAAGLIGAMEEARGE